MNATEKLVAAARRRAKTLARTSGDTHQQCLDAVARSAGRATWAAFIADPKPVDPNSASTAGEPDFTSIPAERHVVEIVRHGLAISARSFGALPTNHDDPTPTLTYELEDGATWGIDARGVDLLAVAEACVGPSRYLKFGTNVHTEHYDGLLPSFENAPMRATAVLYGPEDMRMGACIATLDGSEPERILYTLYQAPYVPAENHSSSSPISWKEPLRRRMAKRLRLAMHGADRIAIGKALESGIVTTDRGPVIAIADGREIRLAPGRNLTCYSPPGTGRLSGIAAPILFSDPHSSYVVQDDGQIHMLTSGHRATLGRVATIRIDAASADSINPFGREWIDVSFRVDKYLDKISRALSSGDPKAARLISLIARDQIAERGETTIGAIYDAIVRDETHAWSRRTALLLAPLAKAATRRVTDTSTIVPSDLFGTTDEGIVRPLTLYVVRDPMAGGRRNPIAATIQTAIWCWTLSGKPGEDRPDGSSNGPCPVATILYDEHDLPAMDTMTEVMDLGRAMKTSVIVLGSTRTSVEDRYGKEMASVIESMTNVRLLLPQSDPGQYAAMDRYGDVGHDRVRALDFGDAYLATSSGKVNFKIRLPLFFENEAMRAVAHSRGMGLEPVEASD